MLVLHVSGKEMIKQGTDAFSRVSLIYEITSMDNILLQISCSLKCIRQIKDSQGHFICRIFNKGIITQILVYERTLLG